MANPRDYLFFLGLAASVVLGAIAQPALAQSGAVRELEEARSFFALPVEVDADRGAANGNAVILRIAPLYSFTLTDNWKLVNLTVFSLADAPGLPSFPSEPGARKEAGISDLLHTSFFTPNRSGNVVWGIGPVLSIPTATDAALGSEKWAAGPAVRFAYRTEKWNLGFIAAQRWSIAGTRSRADVNQLLIRGAIRRQLPNDWYLVSAPIITANWDRADQHWLVPVGGGIGRTFKIKGYPWAWSVQGYYNAIKADVDPDWIARFAIIAAIPSRKK
jgi:hypothetical protein